MSRGELAIGVRGASPQPFLGKLEKDIPCTEVAVAAHPALPCLSKAFHACRHGVGSLLLALEGAGS